MFYVITYNRQKLKNEKAENREQGLFILERQISSSGKAARLALHPDCHEVWISLLADALESPDLKEQPLILVHFINISETALAR